MKRMKERQQEPLTPDPSPLSTRARGEMACPMNLDPFDAYTRHVNPGLGRFLALAGRGLRFVRAEGCVLETADGRRYDDWLSGFGAFNLGHNPPALAQVIRDHLDGAAPNLYVENLNPFAGELAARLVRA